MIYYEIIKSIHLIFSDFWRCLLEALSFVCVHSDSIRNIAQTIQSVVTSIGIIIAGIWFIRKRQQFPRANLTHKIIHKELDIDKNTLLVHVTVTIQNIGNVLINVDHAEIRVHWVAPLTQELDENIIKSENNRDLEIVFPLIDSKELKRTNNNTINVEPGETHDIDCDFILKKNFSYKGNNNYDLLLY